jgi:hypothetical protein
MPLVYELLVPTGYHVEAGVDKLVKIISETGKVQKAEAPDEAHDIANKHEWYFRQEISKIKK